MIPAVRITLADANALRSALRFRSRTRSGVMVSLQVDFSVRSGADAFDRALMYTPNPFQIRVVGVALGRGRLSEPADGAGHQLRPDAFAGAAGGPDAPGPAGPRLALIDRRQRQVQTGGL